MAIPKTCAPGCLQEHTRRRSFEVLILSMAVVKGFSDVYLPDTCLSLFSKEDHNGNRSALFKCCRNLKRLLDPLFIVKFPRRH